MRQSPFRATIALAGLVMLVCMATQANAQTAILSVRAHTGNDTLYVGMPGAIQVYLDPGPAIIASVQTWLITRFTNGNIVGPLPTAEQPVMTSKTQDAFESINVFSFSLFQSGADPDTSFVGAIDFDGEAWNGNGELWRYTFTPSDTGTIHFDLYTTVHISLYTSLVDLNANDIPFIPDTPFVTVVPCSAGNLDGGDANFDRVVTSSDIIYLVNHVFKSGIEPVIKNMGDTDCTNTITAADIIFLVGYVFKSQEPPCDPCETVP